MKKKHPSLTPLLLYPAMLAANLILFPFFCALFHVIDKGTPQNCLQALALAEAAGLIALSVRLAMERFLIRMPVIAGRIVRGILLAGAGIGAYLMMPGAGFVRLVTAGGSAVAYYQGSRLVPRGYEFLASQLFFSAEMGANLFSGAAIVIMNIFSEPPRQFEFFPMATAFLIFIAIYCICENQANIDAMMRRRGYSADSLPPKVRRYSLKLVLILLMAMIAGYLFHQQIEQFFVWVWESFKTFYFRMVDYLASLIHIETFIETGEGKKPVEFTDGVIDFTWLWVLLGIVVVIILIAARKEIIALVRSLAEKVRQWFSRFFHRDAFFRDSGSRLGYIDQVETVGAQKGWLWGKNKYSSRQWRREYRSYQYQKNGEKRFRRGYALLQKGLRLAGEQVPASQTPSELLARARRTLHTEEFSTAIDGYNRVRYAQEPTRKREEAAMDETLSVLEKLL